MARSREPSWYFAVQAEAANAGIMVIGSAVILYWMLVRLHPFAAVLMGAVLGSAVGFEFGRLEGRYVVHGLQVSGSVTRTWKDPNPGGALATVVPILLVIAAGYATQSGVPGYSDLLVGAMAFFFFHASVSSSMAVVMLSGFEHSLGRHIKERMTGTSFEYTLEDETAG